MEVESEENPEYEDPTSVTDAIVSALRPATAEFVVLESQMMAPPPQVEEEGGEEEEGAEECLETFTTLETSVPYPEGTIVETFDIQMKRPPAMLETVEVETTSDGQQQEVQETGSADLQGSLQNLEARIIKAGQKVKWAESLETKGFVVCTVPGCHMRYSTVESFEEHYMWCTGDKGMGVEHCPYCENQFLATDDGILTHILDSHPDDVEDYQVKRGERLAAAITRLVVSEEAKRQAERARKGQSRPTDTLLGRYPDIETPGMLNLVISKPRIKKKDGLYSKKKSVDESDQPSGTYVEKQQYLKKASANKSPPKKKMKQGGRTGSDGLGSLVIKRKVNKPVIIPSRNWSAPRKTYSRNPFSPPSQLNKDGRRESTDAETTDNDLDKSYTDTDSELDPLQLRLPQNCANLSVPIDLYDRDEEDVDGDLEMQPQEDENGLIPDLMNGQVIEEQVVYEETVVDENQLLLTENQISIDEGATCTVQTTSEEDNTLVQKKPVEPPLENIITQVPQVIQDKRSVEEVDKKKRRVIFVVQSKEGATSGRVLHSGKKVTVLKAILKDGSVLTGKDKLGQPIRAVFKRAHIDSETGQSESETLDLKRTKIIIKAAGPIQSSSNQVLPTIDTIQTAEGTSTDLVQSKPICTMPEILQIATSSNLDDQMPHSPEPTSPIHEVPVQNKTVYPTIEVGVSGSNSDLNGSPEKVDGVFTPTVGTLSVGRGQSFRGFSSRRRGYILKGTVTQSGFRGRGFRSGRRVKSGRPLGKPSMNPRSTDHWTPSNSVSTLPVVKRPRGRPPGRSPGRPPGRSPAGSGDIPSPGKTQPFYSLVTAAGYVLEGSTEEAPVSGDTTSLEKAGPLSLNTAEIQDEAEATTTGEPTFLSNQSETDVVTFGFDFAAEEVVSSTLDVQAAPDSISQSSVPSKAENNLDEEALELENNVIEYDEELETFECKTTSDKTALVLSQEVNNEMPDESESTSDKALKTVSKEVGDNDICPENVDEPELETTEDQIANDLQDIVEAPETVIAAQEEVGTENELLEYEDEVPSMQSSESYIVNEANATELVTEIVEGLVERTESANVLSDTVQSLISKVHSTIIHKSEREVIQNYRFESGMVEGMSTQVSVNNSEGNVDVIVKPRRSLRGHGEDTNESNNKVKVVGKKKKSIEIKEAPLKEKPSLSENLSGTAKRGSLKGITKILHDSASVDKPVENIISNDDHSPDTNDKNCERRKSLRTRGDETNTPDNELPVTPKNANKGIMENNKVKGKSETTDNIKKVIPQTDIAEKNLNKKPKQLPEILNVSKKLKSTTETAIAVLPVSNDEKKETVKDSAVVIPNEKDKMQRRSLRKKTELECLKNSDDSSKDSAESGSLENVSPENKVLIRSSPNQQLKENQSVKPVAENHRHIGVNSSLAINQTDTALSKNIKSITPQTINSNITETSSVKRRGRPPKIRQIDSQNSPGITSKEAFTVLKSTHDIESTLSPTSEAIISPPKTSKLVKKTPTTGSAEQPKNSVDTPSEVRRGRASTKIQTEPLQTPVSPKSLVEISPEGKRPRGRPPKKRSEILVNETNLSTTSSTLVSSKNTLKAVTNVTAIKNFTTVSVTFPAPVKVVNKISKTLNDVIRETKQVEATPVVKRRGRPPFKIKFEEALAKLKPNTDEATISADPPSTLSVISSPEANVIDVSRAKPVTLASVIDASKAKPIKQASVIDVSKAKLVAQASVINVSNAMPVMNSQKIIQKISTPVSPTSVKPTTMEASLRIIDSTVTESKPSEITPVAKRRGRPRKIRIEESPIPTESLSLANPFDSDLSEPLSSLITNSELALAPTKQVPVIKDSPSAILASVTYPSAPISIPTDTTVPVRSSPIYCTNSIVPPPKMSPSISRPVTTQVVAKQITNVQVLKPVSTSPSSSRTSLPPALPKSAPSFLASPTIHTRTRASSTPVRAHVVPESSEHDPTLLPPQKVPLSSILLKKPFVPTSSKRGRPVRKRKKASYLEEYLENDENPDKGEETEEQDSWEEDEEEDEEENPEDTEYLSEEEQRVNRTKTHRLHHTKIHHRRKRLNFGGTVEENPSRLMQEIFPYKNSVKFFEGHKTLFKCGACKVAFDTYTKVRNHILSCHNGLANINSDKPVPREEIQIRMRLALKIKKILICHKPNCGKGYRSVMGFLNHSKYCGKEVVLETCDICNEKVRPHTMTYHKRRHLQQEKELQRLIDLNSYDAPPDDEVKEQECTRKRRQAAIAAKSRLQEFVREEIEHGTDDIQDDGELSDPNDQAYSARKSDEEGKSEQESEVEDFEDEEISNKGGEKIYKAKLKEMECFFKYPNKNRTLDKKTNDAWTQELNDKGNITCKEIGCEKVFTTKVAMLYHWQHCQITSDWTCLRCYNLTTFKNGYSLYKHLVWEHRPELPMSVLSTLKHIPARPKYVKSKPVMVQKDYACNPSKTVTSVKLPHQALQFCKKHYAYDVFPQWRPRKKHWEKIIDTVAFELPFRESVQFRLEEDGGGLMHNPQTLGLHETTSLKDPVEHITMNVGGPAWASAWCPTPYYRCVRQYIGVAVSLEPDRTHLISDTTPHGGILQIWRAGGILTRLSMESQPCVMLSVAHEYGAVWDLCWCPSGAWEDPSLETSAPGILSRLGLIAVACGDGSARILSIPHPYENQKKDLYHVSPVAVLIPPNEGSSVTAWRAACTAVSWQRTDSHSTLLAGYGNGCICQFDLLSRSPLLVLNVTPTVMGPFLMFNAHSSAITKLTFAPVSGSRFCASAGLDRATRIWDLQDTSIPIHEKRKGIVRDLAWNCHWCGYFGSQEECYNLNLSHTFYMECGYFNLPKRPLSSHGACTWGISISEWLNCEASCDSAGEVVMMGLTESDHSLDNIKNFTLSRMPIYRMELEPVQKEGQDINIHEIATSQKKQLMAKPTQITKKASSVSWHTPICINEDDPDDPMAIDNSIEIQPIPVNNNNSSTNIECNSSETVLDDLPMRTEAGSSEECVPSKDNEGKPAEINEPQRLKDLAACKTYAAITNKYRLVIKDAPMRNLMHNKKEDGKRLAVPQTMNHLVPGQYMLASVNTICWNPNPGCHWWVFSAGQAGLARLSCVSNLNQPIFEKQIESMQLLARKSAWPSLDS